MPYLFTSESVSEGHPDKVADQISDALIDHFLAFDKDSKVACETLVTTGQVILAGEVKSNTYLDVQKIARDTINKIGYTKGAYMFDGNSCGVLSAIHEQSDDINRGVDRATKEQQGAGDQGMMFGYATNETENFMPLALDLSHLILKELAELRRENNEITYLRPDSKSQVTIEYSDDNVPQRIDAIVVSTQHDDFADDDTMLAKIRKDIVNILIPRVISKLPENLQALFNSAIKYHINPTGKFVIGGPHGDTGLTGTKIIVEDTKKKERGVVPPTRHIAKNLVAAGVADEVLVQVSYAIGVVEPMGIFINTYGTCPFNMTDGEIAEIVAKIFDMRPFAIEERLKLRAPIYSETAAYGHMGRENTVVTKTFNQPNGESITLDVELFTWEKLDYVDQVKAAFGL